MGLRVLSPRYRCASGSRVIYAETDNGNLEKIQGLIEQDLGA